MHEIKGALQTSGAAQQKKKEELLERILLHLNFKPASLCSESKLWLYFAGGGAADEQPKKKLNREF